MTENLTPQTPPVCSGCGGPLVDWVWGPEYRCYCGKCAQTLTKRGRRGAAHHG